MLFTIVSKDFILKAIPDFNKLNDTLTLSNNTMIIKLHPNDSMKEMHGGTSANFGREQLRLLQEDGMVPHHD